MRVTSVIAAVPVVGVMKIIWCAGVPVSVCVVCGREVGLLVSNEVW